MIPVSAPAWQSDPSEVVSWQVALQQAITDPELLCKRLQIPMAQREAILDACRKFPLKVPEPYLNRMACGDARDPLLLQVLPQAQELEEAIGFVDDPLDERGHNPVPGLIHKYATRVLLITTSLCAVHCRYCFRREFPYDDNRNSRDSWQQALTYIRQHTELNEVILSGGDPLALPDRQLAWLSEAIADIPHIIRLRMHTRLPVVIPQRVNTALLDWLDRSRLQKVIVLHCNHPNEIDDALLAATRQLTDHNITLLNQSVLLAGINDSATTLAQLSEKLFAAGVQPYYLHQLDKVRGSQHFSVSDADALSIHQQLQSLLPGFLVPTLAREEAGKPGKSRLI